MLFKFCLEQYFQNYENASSTSWTTIVNMNFYNVIIILKLDLSHFVEWLFCTLIQSFNEYFTVNHNRLLGLWRAVMTFRRQFVEMKAASEHDMTQMKAEFSRVSRNVHSSCLNLGSNLRFSDVQNQVDVYG